MEKSIVIITVILGAIIAWGIIGGVQASSAEKICDVGFTAFCWKWEATSKVVSDSEVEKELDLLLNPVGNSIRGGNG